MDLIILLKTLIIGLLIFDSFWGIKNINKKNQTNWLSGINFTRNINLLISTASTSLFLTNKDKLYGSVSLVKSNIVFRLFKFVTLLGLNPNDKATA